MKRWAGRVGGRPHPLVDSTRRAPPGSDTSTSTRCSPRARQIGYAGYLSAEAFPHPDADTAARQTVAAFRYWTAT
ncbi:MAG: hypothetical protein U0736_27200 [Gemmataceae bacterium]